MKVGKLVKHRIDGRIGFICKKSIFKNFKTVFWFCAREIRNDADDDLEAL